MTTLAKYFADLRAAADLSYSEVAKKCRIGKKTLSRHVVWKIENGKPVKADTLALVLHRGLGIPRDDEVYLEAIALWSAGQSKTATAPDLRATMARMKLGNDKAFAAFAKDVLAVLADVPAGDRSACLEALRALPALKLWLASRK